MNIVANRPTYRTLGLGAACVPTTPAPPTGIWYPDFTNCGWTQTPPPGSVTGDLHAIAAAEGVPIAHLAPPETIAVLAAQQGIPLETIYPPHVAAAIQPPAPAAVVYAPPAA